MAQKWWELQAAPPAGAVSVTFPLQGDVSVSPVIL